MADEEGSYYNIDCQTKERVQWLVGLSEFQHSDYDSSLVHTQRAPR